MNQTVLEKGIKVVGVLFAAFGGFLAGIAPPQAADARFAVGIGSVLVLIILFIVSALTRKKHRNAWLVAGTCLLVATIGAAYYYKSTYNSLTFEYPPNSTEVEHIAGTELTEAAKTYKQQHVGISNSQLLAAFGGPQNILKVWSEGSRNNARMKLISSYVMLVMALAAAIFALTEGALGNVPAAKQKGRRATPAKPRKDKRREKNADSIAPASEAGE